MVGLAAILGTFLLPFVLLRRGARQHVAWFASCCVVPAVGIGIYILFPVESGPLWAVGVAYGSIFGVAVAGVGTFLAARMLRSEQNRDI
jgi:cyanate permease